MQADQRLSDQNQVEIVKTTEITKNEIKEVRILIKTKILIKTAKSRIKSWINKV